MKNKTKIIISLSFIACFIVFLSIILKRKPPFAEFRGPLFSSLYIHPWPLSDELGNYLFHDKDLNIIFLAHTGDPDIEKIVPVTKDYETCVFFKNSKFEFELKPKKNSIIIINLVNKKTQEIEIDEGFVNEHLFGIYERFFRSGREKKPSLFEVIQNLVPEKDIQILLK